MGKRYKCDYCNKIMVSAPYTVKTHNQGLPHQKLVHDHYQLYKDPAQILEEERNKKPCTRNHNGGCQFGFMCRFSHYTPEQIMELRHQVASRKSSKTLQTQPSFQDLYQKLQDEKSTKLPKDNETTILCDDNGNTYVLPWTYNAEMNIFDNKPVSLKRLEIEDFANASFNKWG